MTDLSTSLGYDPHAPDLAALVAAGAADRWAWLRDVRRRWPLAASPLWVKPEATWDQRRAVIACMEAPVIATVLGGNRSGKTTGLRQLSIANLLGGDHRITRAWCELNGLDASLIPSGPGVGYMIGPSSGDSIRFHRGPVEALLGDIPHSEYNRNSKGEAWLFIDVEGYDKPAELWFKSIDQGARAHQGISLRFATIDEEPEGDNGRQVLTELYMRVADQAGKIWIGMNPNQGLTWVYDDLIVKREHDCRVIELDALDNPTIPKAFMEALFRGMDADQLAQRRFGQFRSRAGLIYQLWAEGDGAITGGGHVCDPFPIPNEWPKFRGGDFGQNAPTAIVWGALAPDGVLYVYREHYATGLTYEQHARRCAELEAGETIEAGWGDPNESGAIEVFNMQNVHLAKADNRVKYGIDQVRNRLRAGLDNRPRIKVFRTCPNLIREKRGYVWSKDGVNPLKRNDHACDAERYMVVGIEAWLGL